MKTIYIVEALGGQYEDSWEHIMRASESREAAQAAIDQYVKWEEELKTVEYPEACELHNFDEENDREMEIYQERRSEFEKQVMIEMGIPEFDHPFMLDLFTGSGYGYDMNGYMIRETVLV